MLVISDAPRAYTIPAVDLRDAPNLRAIRERGTWRFGVSADMHPLAGIDAVTGEWSGFEVDLARIVAQSLFQCSAGARCAGGSRCAHVAFQPTPFGDRIGTLQRGEVDTVIAVFADTAARREQVTFAGHYLTGKPALLLGPDSPQVTSIDDFAGLRLAVLPGSTGVQHVVELAPRALPQEMEDTTACHAALVTGQAQAFWGSELENHGFLQAAGPEFRQVVLPVRSEPWAFGVQKGAQDLRRYINDVVAELVASWTLDRLRRRWFRPLDVVAR